MNSLLPHNATPQEVALDLTTARVGGVDVPIRSLWNPDTCPADVLPWLAWAFSVDQWDAAWTIEQKRAVVAASIDIHKRKGTPRAVKEIIELIFGGGDLVEAWQSSDLEPHEFKIVTTGLLASESDYDKLIDLVDASKPVRSWLVAIQIKRSATANLTWAGYTHAATESLIYGRLNVGAEALPLSVGTGYHTANTTEVSPAGVTFNIPDFAVIAGTGYHLSNKTTIQPEA